MQDRKRVETEALIQEKITELDRIKWLYEGVKKQLENYSHIAEIELTENQLAKLGSEIDKSMWIKFAENIKETLTMLNGVSGELQNLFDSLEKTEANEKLFDKQKTLINEIRTGLNTNKKELMEMAATLRDQKKQQFPGSSKIKEAKRRLGKGTKKMFSKMHKKSLKVHQENLMAITKERQIIEKKLAANATPQLDYIEKKMKQLMEAVSFEGINKAAKDIKKWKETPGNANQLAALVQLAELQGKIQQRWQASYMEYQTELKALQSLVVMQIENNITKLTEKDNEKNKNKIDIYKDMLDKVKKNDLTQFEKYIDHSFIKKTGIKKINGLKDWLSHAKDFQSFDNKMKNALSSESMLALTLHASDIDTFAAKLKADLKDKKEFIKKDIPKTTVTETQDINLLFRTIIDIKLTSDLTINKEFQDLLDKINHIKSNVETRDKMISTISDLSNHPEMQDNEKQLSIWTKKLNSLTRDNVHDQTILAQFNEGVNGIYTKAIDQCVKGIDEQIAYHDLKKDKLTSLKAIPGMSEYLSSHADQAKRVNEADAKIERELQINKMIADASQNTGLPEQSNPKSMAAFLSNAENKAYLATLKDTERFEQFSKLYYQETMQNINTNVDKLMVGFHGPSLSNLETFLNEHGLMDEEKKAAIDESRNKINNLTNIETQYISLNKLVKAQLETPSTDVEASPIDVKLIDSSINQIDAFIITNKKFLVANNFLSDLNIKRADLERQKLDTYTIGDVAKELEQIDKRMDELNDPCHVKLQMLLSNPHIQDILKSHKNLEDKAISLSNHSYELMANTLTAQNKKIFENFDSYELLRDPLKEPIPTLTAFIQFFNKTAAFIISDILSRKSIDERTAAIEYWISIAEKSLSDPLIKDINLAFTINAALNDSSISRLKASWEGISSHAENTMQYLNHLADPQFSAKNLREYTQDHSSIPYLANNIRDFTNVREGSNTELVELVGSQGFELAYHQFANVAAMQKQSNLIKVKHPASGIVLDAIQHANRNESAEYKISKDLESSDEDKRPKKSNIMSTYKNLYVPDNRSQSVIEQTLPPIERAADNVIILNKDNLDFLPNLRQAGYQVGIITDGIDAANIPSDVQFKLSNQTMQNDIDTTVDRMREYYSTHKFELYSLVTYGVVLPDTALIPRIAEQIKKMDNNPDIFNQYFEKLKPVIINDFMVEQIALQSNIEKNNIMLMDVYANDFLSNKRRHGLNENDLVHDSPLKKGMAILYLLQYEPHLSPKQADKKQTLTDQQQKLIKDNNIETIKRYLSKLSGDDLIQFYALLNRPIGDNKKVIDDILSINSLPADLKIKLETLYDQAAFSLKNENKELKTKLENSYMELKNYKDAHDGMNQGSETTRKGHLARSIWVGLNSKLTLNEKIVYLKDQLESNTLLYPQDDKMRKITKSIQKEPILVKLMRETLVSLENYAKAEQAYLIEQGNQRKIKARQESPVSPRQESQAPPAQTSPRVESSPQPAEESIPNLPPLPEVPVQRPEITLPRAPETMIDDLPRAPDVTKESIALRVNKNLAELQQFEDPIHAGQVMDIILEDIMKIYQGILEAKTKEEMQVQQQKLNEVTNKYNDNYGSDDWNRIETIEKHLSDQQTIINQKNNILPRAPKPHTSTYLINGALDEKKTMQQKINEGMQKAAKYTMKQADKVVEGAKNMAQDLNDKRKNININLPKFKSPELPKVKLPKSKLPVIKSSRDNQYPRVKDENAKPSLMTRGKNFLSRFSRQNKQFTENKPLLVTSTFFAHEELAQEAPKSSRPTMEVRDVMGNILSPSQTKEAYQGERDYSAFRGDLNIGFSELRGKREGQEDRVVVSAIENCSSFNKDDVIKLLETTIDEANTRCGQEDRAGSTLVAAVVHQDHVYTVNVGDSSNYLITVDQFGQFNAKRLNENLHHPLDDKEFKYIQDNKGTVTAMGVHGRLNNKLAVSRAIGDQEHGEAINHTPEISADKIYIPPGGFAFMITCCDGLTEGHDMAKSASESYVKDLAKACMESGINPSTDPGKFAQALANKAIENGSEDNVSVVVTPLQKNDATTKLVAVFDGHGGSKVSQALHENFTQIMNEKVAELKVTSSVRMS